MPPCGVSMPCVGRGHGCIVLLLVLLRRRCWRQMSVHDMLLRGVAYTQHRAFCVRRALSVLMGCVLCCVCVSCAFYVTAAVQCAMHSATGSSA